MAARAAPGGASTIALGSTDPKESFDQRLQERLAQAALETPEAAPRFPQAPGGDASICLRGGSAAGAAPASVTRGPVGGATSLVLGGEGGGLFKRHAEDFRAAPVAPPAPRRFPQAPGGDASVLLGGAELLGSAATEAAASRGPVGGAVSVVLGTDAERFPRCEERQADAEVPAAALRFQQAPGGTSSICLGGAAAAEGACGTRGPVGGAVSVVLGGDSAAEAFAQRQQEREAAVETPAAAPRFQQAPGGVSSISLGGAGSEGSPAGDAATSRPPVGGAASVVLGSDDSKQLLGEYEERRGAGVETPGALPRFSQAPGGGSTVCLGAPSNAALPDAVTVRGPVGGATSICLGGDEASLPSSGEATGPRGSAGGAASIVLGTDDVKEVFDERREQRELPVDTPAAALRFQQAPGGTSSVCLGGDGAEGLEGAAAAPRGPVGGAATVVLGSDDRREVFGEREAERAPPAGTPEAAPRFTQAPGGNASVSWTPDGASDAESSKALSTRGPVGGATSVQLGGDDPAAAFRLHEAKRSVCVETPDAALRFQQAPGGTSSLSLAGDGATLAAVAVRGPVGGEATITLGSEAPEDAFRQEPPTAGLETPEPAPRFQQAPGGDASICLDAGGPPGAQADAPVVPRGEVGGTATVVLGIDDSREILRRHGEQRQAAVDTPVAAARFPQAPGGTSQVLLAGGAPEAARGVGSRCAPGGAASLVLGGDYPDEVPARRPATRLHQAPGGTATIELGDCKESAAPAERASANSFARGSSQNTGNILTDRSTTRLHQAPGGTSTLCLGGDYPEDSKAAPSANRFASGASPNCGNALSDRPTTRLHQAPGGNSTLSLGQDADASSANKAASAAKQPADENTDTSNVAAARRVGDVIKPEAVEVVRKVLSGKATREGFGRVLA